MRLLLNYKGINKIMPNVENYAGIVQFIHENFFLKMSNWTLSYFDDDGDSISLDSELDLQTMMDTITKDHIKVYIKDAEPSEQKLFNKTIESSEDFVDNEEPKQEIQSSKEPVPLNSDKKLEEEKVELPQVEKACRWKEHWKRKMEQKMAKFVDERVESLIPCLTKKIQNQINDVQPKLEVRGVTHDTQCTGCGIFPIVGIRYKCTKCPSFDFCENCETTISHDHNMIKMKFLQEGQKEEEKREQCSGNDWKPCEKSESNCRFRGHHQDDKDLVLTRKCFRMAKLFGQNPSNYREFVEKNLELKFNELTQLYVSENEGVGVVGEANDKIEERLQKLSFYFNEPKETFESFVKKNPVANLKELIKAVKKDREERVPSAIVEEKKEEQKIEQKQQPKEEEKQEIEPVKESSCLIDDLLSEMEPVRTRKIIDPKKKTATLELMKEYFGYENVFDYIKFYDANSHLESEEIIAKYIEKLLVNL